MSTQARFRVAISGGGIGGLALAAFICHHADDVAVDIYETRPEISSIGAGIAIWKRTWQTLQDIGLDEEVKKRNLPLPKDGESIGPIFRKGDQPTEGIDFHNHMMPYGPLSIPRPILLDMLKSRLNDNCTVYTSARVAGYDDQPDGTVLLKMGDGSTHSADVLIGCDGVHSAIRAALFQKLAENDPSKGYEQFVEPKWSGTLAYRSAANRTELRKKNPKSVALETPRIWCGKTKHAVTNPFGDDVGLICFYNEEGGYGKPFTDPWVMDVSLDEVLKCFEGWEPDLLEVISMAPKFSRWAVHLVENLPLYVNGPVGLLGDAAHAMTTHQGVGGGQAIEDAHLLGRLLADKRTTKGNLTKVLKIYEDIRLPFATQAADRSWKNGLLYDFCHPDFPVSPNATAEDLKPLGEEVGATFAWLGKGGCDEEWDRADALLGNL